MEVACFTYETVIVLTIFKGKRLVNEQIEKRGGGPSEPEKASRLRQAHVKDESNDYS